MHASSVSKSAACSHVTCSASAALISIAALPKREHSQLVRESNGVRPESDAEALTKSGRMAVKTLILLALSVSAQRTRLDVHTDNDNDTHSGKLNVYGAPLKKCSGPGMALTGFTREGTCTDRVDDAGSHHICIEMDSVDGGNFCEVTGQPNWCDDYMQCDGKRGLCPVQHWCVCEWAFASYITRAGGCDKIQSIDCEATNRWAYLHYQQKGASEALACLESRCGLGGTSD